MIVRSARIIPQLVQRNVYTLLKHTKMDEEKAKLFGDQQRTFYLKLKFILKQTKYTLVQGSKDLWHDTKWALALYKNKTRSQFTGYQLAQSSRIIVDLMKFIPYSILLAIPLAQVFIPVLVWIFPNAIPSFFLFDTAEDRRIEKLQLLQEESHKILLERLLKVLRDLSKREQQFTSYDFFKQDFFQVIEDLNINLNYKNFNSDELIQVLQFLGGNYMTGTATINKIINLFTVIIPRSLIKIARYLYRKLARKELKPYKDPFFIKGDFHIFRFNYFPFEYLKRKFLLFQISQKFKTIQMQDEAFQKYGMKDIEGTSIKDFARERGFAALTCYDTLKNVLNNDWVKITTHPKFQDNNTKIWYSVMMYHFLAQTNHDLN